MNAQLLCRARGGANLTLKVPAGEAVLGRDNAAQVVVPLDGVSRRHARILFEGNAYWLQDLKSTNGTFLNGSTVTGDARERLRHLDVIGLGRDAELVFVLREKAAAPEVKKVIKDAELVLEEPEGGEYKIAIGEVTLGRSTAANVAVDRAAISKLHARIQRSADQLLLQDLNSVNGTFVNGTRVTTALLNDGDRISLANVASFRLAVEWGENTSASGASIILRAAAPSVEAEANQPEFKKEWKTRLEWDASEQEELKKIRQGVAPAEVGGSTSPQKAVAAAKPAAPAPAAKPAAPAPKPAAAPPAPAAAKPAAPPAAPPKPAPPAPAPKPAEVPKPIAELRLTGSSFDFAVTEAGTYDLGRADAARLRLANATVSRNHARVILAADRMSAQVEHVGKTTPTLVNGTPITAPKNLADGDTIVLGEVSLVVKITRK